MSSVTIPTPSGDTVKPHTRTRSAVLAVAMAGGVSTLLMGAVPAYAAEGCGPTGALVAPGICEQVVTSGTGTFTPTASMTTLEVLLVGAGGSGADQPAVNTNGYAAAGGGGEVKIVDLSGTTDPITYSVPSPGTTGDLTAGATVETVGNGEDASAGSGNTAPVGGASGNGNLGGHFDENVQPGGGAGAAPTDYLNGGAGVTVSEIAGVGSLFAGDTRCFGGGGAIGYSAEQFGVPGCGAGGPDATGDALIAPLANSGGGGGGVRSPQDASVRAGASGIVIFRWSAETITLTFDVRGVGTAPAPQSVVAGTAATQPEAPSAAGYRFDGWYTDEQLTAPADFSAPLEGSTTFYAKWVAVTQDPTPPGRIDTAAATHSPGLSIALPALVAGMGVAALLLPFRRPKKS